MSEAGAANYPLFLNLQNQLVVVVGAGQVGRRKADGVLGAGGLVRLVDPQLASMDHCEAGVDTVAAEFHPEHLRGAILAFACTDNSMVNQQVVAEARKLGLFCCRADQPLAGDFTVPAVLSRGQLTVAVSTCGASPGLAAIIRDQVADQVSENWGLAVEIIAAVRRMWLTEKIVDKYNQKVLRNFWEKHLLPLLEEGKFNDVDRLLQETFGAEYSLGRLQVKLPEGAHWEP